MFDPLGEFKWEKRDDPYAYYAALGDLLGATTERIQEELSEGAILIDSGFLQTFEEQYRHHGSQEHHSNRYYFTDSLPVHAFRINPVLPKILKRHHATADRLIEPLLGTPVTGHLSVDDYDYMADIRDKIVYSAAGAVRDTKARGKGQIWYGVPGCGKSQFRNALCALLGLKGYVVGQRILTEGGTLNQAAEREPTAKEKIAMLRVATFIVERAGLEDVILFFEEADDALTDVNDSGTNVDRGTVSKGYRNDTIENHGAFVVYISNRPDKMELATIRRVLPAFPFFEPPARIHAKIMQSTAKDLGVPLGFEEALGYLRKYPQLTTAMTEYVLRSVGWIKVGQEILRKNDVGIQPADIEQMFRYAVQALNGGYDPIPRILPEQSPIYFELYHTKHDLERIAEEIRKGGENPKTSLCISGPNGAGKRSYLRWLAGKIDMDVMEVPYTGNIDDKNLSTLLAKAEREKAMVIFVGADQLFDLPRNNHFILRMRDHPLPIAVTARHDQTGHYSLMEFDYLGMNAAP